MSSPTWSVPEAFRRRATQRPTDVLFGGDSGAVTAAAFDRATNAVAGALVAQHCAPGDRIGYLGRPRQAYFDLLIGAAKLGVVCVGLNWRLAAEQLAEVIRDAAPRIVVVEAELVDTLAAIVGDLKLAPRIVAIGDGGNSEYEAWCDSAAPVDPGVCPKLTDAAMQIYTSGTTGAAKGVLLTHGTIAATLTVVDRWALGPGCVALVNLPLFHFGGSVWPIQAIAAGGSCVVHRSFDADRVVAEAKALITTAIAVPTMMQAYCESADVLGGPFPSLRCFGYGSAPIREELLLRVMRTFDCDLVQTYGMTETSGVMTQLLPEEHDPAGPRKHLLRSAGRPVPGVELWLGDPATDTRCGPHEVGDIWARTPWTMAGYWQRAELTAETLRDGWLRTGDVGYLDQDGYLYLTDRATDMIITGGENVYPAEVENVLLRHADVVDVAAIGVPHDRWGEQIIAVVIAVPGSSPSAEDLIEFARDRLAHYKCPTQVEFTDSLPRNETGKVLRRELRVRYGGQAALA